MLIGAGLLILLGVVVVVILSLLVKVGIMLLAHSYYEHRDGRSPSLIKILIGVICIPLGTAGIGWMIWMVYTCIKSILGYML